MVNATTSVNDRQWYIVGRWQEYEGEGRANLIRILAIGIFYSIQLVHYYGFAEHVPGSTEFRQAVAFHQAATALAVAGSLMSLAILLCLRRRVFPGFLKFISAAGDAILVTSLASIGAGPLSPLVAAYFLIIVLAGLRFSLRLVWCSTLCSMAGYLFLVGVKDDEWFDANHVVAPVEQIMTLACLGLTGIITGQIIRRVRALADDYSRRVAAASITSNEQVQA
ncbi:MAG: hypothetical protein O3C40_30650 [Planctomycetota bacterium]|nr:hypothetical protein [Planctomycetota bacterium]